MIDGSSKRELYFELPDGKFRKATDAERAQALAAERLRVALNNSIQLLSIELEELRKHPLPVFYDTPGYIYHERYFVASGRVSMI